VTEEKSIEKPKIYRVATLDELGANLPILRNGRDGQPVQDRSFSFLDWDMEVEEKISKIQSNAKNVGSLVSQMMCLLLDRFCGESFQELSKEDQILTVNQLEFTNVMYMYIFLRTEELGYDLKMDVTCPHCKKLNKGFVADLRTLEVHVKEEEHERQHTYELMKPILMDNGDVVSSVTYDISKWDTMERATPDVAENAGKMKQILFRSSIANAHAEDDGGKEKNYPIDLVIKKMKKIDIEKISSAITENNAGPLMAMKGECIHCKSEWFRLLDWSYNFFFDSSSL